MSRSSPRKKPTINYNESDTIPRTNGVVDKAISKARSAISKVTKKRTKASEDHEDTPVEEPTKPAKKRKTTKAKEEDAMPLAERTVVSSLKKGMYIGAHVSAAGGKYRRWNSTRKKHYANIIQVFKTQSPTRCTLAPIHSPSSSNHNENGITHPSPPKHATSS